LFLLRLILSSDVHFYDQSSHMIASGLTETRRYYDSCSGQKWAWLGDNNSVIGDVGHVESGHFPDIYCQNYR